MNKIAIIIFLALSSIHSYSEDLPQTCLALTKFKAIDMTREKVLDINKECSREELQADFINIPNLVLNTDKITNIGISEVSIEDAIKLLKTEQFNTNTEDLIKLMDYYPTVIPAKIYIMSFAYNSLNVKENRHIVMIESEKIKINDIVDHRLIAISKNKLISDQPTLP